MRRYRNSFGNYDSCGLVKADRESRSYTRADYQKACHFSGCPSCAPSRARDWVKRHELKGKVIREDGFFFLLSWPALPVEVKSRELLKLFSDTVWELQCK